MLSARYSGRSARSFDIAWAEELRYHCAQQWTSFFAKQLAAKPIYDSKPLIILNAISRRDGHGGNPTSGQSPLLG